MVVIDLRANGGGNDMWAMKWVRRFSEQLYQSYAGAAELHRRETDPLRRWSCSARLGAMGGFEDSDTPADRQCYKGRLFVITGIHCASSGETFAGLAGQIPGAILVGENTAGFISYGNLDQKFDFSHADIAVHFGRSKFAMGTGKRPACESMGMFPDYWLDDEDPVAAVAAYCSLK